MTLTPIRVRLQPDLNKTLFDNTTIEREYLLTTDQYWGFLVMALVIFGGGDNNIEIWESKGKREIQMKLGYLAYAKGNYILAYDPVYDHNREAPNWIVYLESFQRHVSLPEGPMKDESDLHIYFNDFYCHLIGSGDAVVRFKNAGFIQGAIALLKLSGLDYHDFIFDVSYQRRRMNLK